MIMAEGRREAPHLVVNVWSMWPIVRPAWTSTGASTAIWQHPDGPFWTKCIDSKVRWISLGAGASSSESEHDDDESEEEVESAKDIGSMSSRKWSVAWNIASSGSGAMSKCSGCSLSGTWNGGSGTGGWPPRCNGRVGRHPPRTCLHISCCSHTASTVSSLEYNCILPWTWCPWSRRALEGNRSWAAAERKVTFNECRVYPWASIGVKSLDVQGVWMAHLRARSAPAYAKGEWKDGRW